MPTLNIIDKPVGTFQSVYDPIKISCRVENTDREKYPSVVAIVTPYDLINNEYEYDNQIKIRVPVQPKAPENIDQDGWAATSTLCYSVDLSTICRDFVSFDLRPCTHDTQQYSRKDITQSQISYNTFKYFSVTMRLEYIDTDGVLKEDSTSEDNTQWFPINAAISNDERQGIYFDEIVIDGGGNDVRIGGRGILDIGVCPIVTSRFITDAEPDELISLIETDPNFETDILASAILKFGNVQMSFTCSTQSHLMQHMRFIGTKGRLELPVPFNPIGDQESEIHLWQNVNHPSQSPRVIKIEKSDQYTNQVEQMNNSILNGTTFPYSLEDSLKNMKIIDAIFRSSNSRKWEIV